jgi:erythronate-4-phosphate dehydrogenase
MTADDVRDADVLLVRSITRVDSDLLSGSKVGFVGSATIGTDHVDLDWLGEHGIAFANAPASNAVSAAEYVVTGLLHVAAKQALNLASATVGIIGCGNVGSRVQDRLQAMGLTCLVCDPPRAEKEGTSGFVNMAELVGADIITVHVPLVAEGRHRTLELVDQHFLQSLPAECLFINTSRGDVVDEDALKQKHRLNNGFRSVLDVWNNEPLVDMELAGLADIATPHIAGYSIDGKLRATEMLYLALAEFLGQQPSWDAHSLLPKPEYPVIEPTQGEDILQLASNCMNHVYDIAADDRRMRDTFDLSADKRGYAFDQLRKHYPLRRECNAYYVNTNSIAPEQVRMIERFGFNLV